MKSRFWVSGKKIGIYNLACHNSVKNIVGTRYLSHDTYTYMAYIKWSRTKTKIGSYITFRLNKTLIKTEA